MRHLFFPIVCTIVILLVASAPADKPEPKPKIESLKTPSDVPFAILGQKGSAPAPTLFVFAGGKADSLLSLDFNKIGRILSKEGFLCVSVDIPCHGDDVQAGETKGSIASWRIRMEKGDKWVPAFTDKVRAVLDHLVKEGYTDPKRVAAVGTSRGGFMAAHVAAADPRIRAVVAFAPVTELLAVREFKGSDKADAARALDLVKLVDTLAGRSLWLCIGDKDDRVDTKAAINFTRKLEEASKDKKLPVDVELVVREVPGHTIHKTAHEEAAAWLRKRFKSDK